MIIGLTGKNGSGKGEVVSFLQSRGFEAHSLSDVLRDELKKRGRTPTRDALIKLGNELRRRHGAGVLAERILAKLDIDRHYIIDSIRNPQEVAAFRRRGDFALVCVKAPARIRFERLHKRARERDPKTFEDFLKLEAAEASHPDPTRQLLDHTEKLADRSVSNAGTVAELHRKISTLVKVLRARQKRPDWDEYFMGIARVVSLRSNCLKRKCAAVVVLDRRVISTGYNGTPRGVKNCNEGGCPRCGSFLAQGEKLDECYCCHAEENAITQAAYHGVRIQGASLYTTFSPCLLCAKMIINSGVSEVVYNRAYLLASKAEALLREAGVRIRKLSVSKS